MIFLKVLVKDPVPGNNVKGDAFEDTMMLLEIVREQNMKDKKQEKVGRSMIVLTNYVSNNFLGRKNPTNGIGTKETKRSIRTYQILEEVLL